MHVHNPQAAAEVKDSMIGAVSRSAAELPVLDTAALHSLREGAFASSQPIRVGRM